MRWLAAFGSLICKAGTSLKAQQIMPYIEMAKSPKIQNIIEALKYKTDGGNISREYGGGGGKCCEI